MGNKEEYPEQRIEVDADEVTGYIYIKNDTVVLDLGWEIFSAKQIIPLQEFCDKLGLIKKEENK